MALQPTITLTAREQRLVQSAREKLLARKKPTKAESAAVEKHQLATAELGFLQFVTDCPKPIFQQLLPEQTPAELRALSDRLDISLTGKSVDLAAAFAAAVAIAATAPLTGGTARTYRELAERLGMSGADAVRQLKAWHERGMPGRPGRPGRRDAAFPVDECRSWIAANVQTAQLSGEDGENSNTAELRKRLLLLDLEIKEREKLEQLRRLADVNDVAAFAATCINNAKAVLEAVPDEVYALLPETVAESVKASIHAKAQQLIDTAFEELARLAEGDTDPTDEGEEAGAEED